MKSRIDITQGGLRIAYYQYRSFITPVVVILACILLIFFYIIPQFQEMTDLQGQVQEHTAKLALLKQNLNSLSLIDESSLDSKLRVVAAAVPPNKDYIGILTAVTNAAANSNVAVGDYNFIIGEISNPATGSNEKVTLTLQLKSDFSHTQIFLNELKKQFPLSNIDEFNITDAESALVVVSFYSKPYSSINIDENTIFKPLTQNEESVVSQLTSQAEINHSTAVNNAETQ